MHRWSAQTACCCGRRGGSVSSCPGGRSRRACRSTPSSCTPWTRVRCAEAAAPDSAASPAAAAAPPRHACRCQVSYQAQIVRSWSLVLRTAARHRPGLVVGGRENPMALSESPFLLHPVEHGGPCAESASHACRRPLLHRRWLLQAADACCGTTQILSGCPPAALQPSPGFRSPQLRPRPGRGCVVPLVPQARWGCTASRSPSWTLPRSTPPSTERTTCATQPWSTRTMWVACRPRSLPSHPQAGWRGGGEPLFVRVSGTRACRRVAAAPLSLGVEAEADSKPSKECHNVAAQRQPSGGCVHMHTAPVALTGTTASCTTCCCRRGLRQALCAPGHPAGHTGSAHRGPRVSKRQLQSAWTLDHLPCMPLCWPPGTELPVVSCQPAGFWLRSHLPLKPTARHRPGQLAATHPHLPPACSATRELLKAASDPAARAVLDSRQKALKVTANALYGFTGAGASPLQCIQLADSCLAYGAQSCRWEGWRTCRPLYRPPPLAPPGPPDSSSRWHRPNGWLLMRTPRPAVLPRSAGGPRRCWRRRQAAGSWHPTAAARGSSTATPTACLCCCQRWVGAEALPRGRLPLALLRLLWSLYQGGTRLQGATWLAHALKHHAPACCCWLPSPPASCLTIAQSNYISRLK